ncbi:hypothetical protein ACE193_17315 [Bernardetia sp. OM2101]|uniref:hypothetical protein n=1 Tax=Bernardetia sp. OM2101 TaxID=3344876 RepID=UPI0035D064A4
MKTGKIDLGEFSKEALILVIFLAPYLYALFNWENLPPFIEIYEGEYSLSKTEYIFEGGVAVFVLYILMAGGSNKTKKKRFYPFRLLLHSYASAVMFLIMIGTDSKHINVPYLGVVLTLLFILALILPSLYYKFFRQK